MSNDIGGNCCCCGDLVVKTSAEFRNGVELTYFPCRPTASGPAIGDMLTRFERVFRGPFVENVCSCSLLITFCVTLFSISVVCGAQLGPSLSNVFERASVGRLVWKVALFTATGTGGFGFGFTFGSGGLPNRFLNNVCVADASLDVTSDLGKDGFADGFAIRDCLVARICGILDSTSGILDSDDFWK